MSIEDTKRRLVWHGMFLFLLGLLTGFAEPDFKNVRMALAAHLEGVMNGILIIPLGAVWNELKFSARQNVAAYWTALYGAMATGRQPPWPLSSGPPPSRPSHQPDNTASPWQKNAITAAFTNVGVAIVACAVLVLWGARRATPSLRRSIGVDWAA
jgi:(hydroxyamino)benzene mutase